MNAPTILQHIRAAPYGDTDRVRAELYDALNLMRLRIEAAMIGIEAGDDFALTRSLRLHVIHSDFALCLLVQIEKARDRERKAAKQDQPHSREGQRA